MEVDDIKTGVVEGVLASDFSCIEFALSNLFSELRLRYKQKSIKVDKIFPLCAPNTSGLVRVNVYDWRLDGNDSLQAWFIFPVKCQLENSNIKRGITYCKMKGYLKYSTSDMPEDSQMRAPSIVMLSKTYTNDNVDVWHCPPTKAIPILTRTKFVGLPERRRDLLLGGFGESGLVIHERRGRLSLSEIDVRRGGDDISDVDLGPSISEFSVSKEEVDRRGSVVMDPV